MIRIPFFLIKTLNIVFTILFFGITFTSYLKVREINQIINEVKTQRKEIVELLKKYPFLNYLSLNEDRLDKKFNCSGNSNTVVYIASNDKNSPILSRVGSQLRDQLTQDKYIISQVGSTQIDSKGNDYIDQIKEKYFLECDTSGMFVKILFNQELNILNAEIVLINMDKNLPISSMSNQIIIVNNPPNLNLSIKESSDFLSDFLIALTNYFSGNYLVALDELKELEPSVEGKENSALLNFFKGNIYAIYGNSSSALEAYNKAADLSPSFSNLTQRNKEVSEKIKDIYNKLLKDSTERDSIFNK